MDSEIKNLLESVLAQQVVLYKKLDTIERRLNNSSRFTSLEMYADELSREASELIHR